MMKKVIWMIFAATTVAFTSTVEAADNYMYWMVDSQYITADTDYVQVKWSTVDGSSWGYLVNKNDGADPGQKEFFADTDDHTVVAQYAEFSSSWMNNNYKFLVELFDASGNQIQSQLTWQAFSEIYTVGGFGPEELKLDHMAILGSTNIPEPTGGILALLGFGLLSLRRKQKKV